MEKAVEILKKHWGFADFRPDQKPIIEALIQKQNTLALLPTGGGKSICFQVPGMVLGGLTLVISPLIALMKDQVEGLKKRDIRATAIHSGFSKAEVKQILENALQGHYHFLYISPERLATEAFREYLPNLNIKLFVIDEAHCISMWGPDFRPSYQLIKEVKSLLPGIPIAAFTASAPKWIQTDIIQQLTLENQFVYQGDFFRSNLIFYNISTENKSGTALRLLKRSQGSAIVFGSSRREVEETCRFLQAQGLSATFYHAGLSGEERNLRQRNWIRNQARIMVCTNAFGMGVDKPDVRLVVHLKPPKNPEDYYQEAGRAGRDGNPAHGILLHQPSDWLTIKEQIIQQHPPKEVLERMYHITANALQLAPGNGAGEPHHINPVAVAEKYHLKLSEYIIGLKALEVCKQIRFLESSWMPSRVQFIASYQEVYDLRIRKSTLSDLTDVLLRSHGGIFEHPVVIQEAQLAKRLRLAEVEIKRQLNQLKQMRLMEYWPQSDLPSVMFLEGRSMYPSIDIQAIEILKTRKLEAFQHLHEYAHQNACRSAFWQHYFQPEKTDSNFQCGKCDVCKSKVSSNSKRQTDTSSSESTVVAANLENAGADHPNTIENTEFAIHQWIESYFDDHNQSSTEDIQSALELDGQLEWGDNFWTVFQSWVDAGKIEKLSNNQWQWCED